jgi:hypothetical protein
MPALSASAIALWRLIESAIQRQGESPTVTDEDLNGREERVTAAPGIDAPLLELVAKQVVSPLNTAQMQCLADGTRIRLRYFLWRNWEGRASFFRFNVTPEEYGVRLHAKRELAEHRMQSIVAEAQASIASDLAQIERARQGLLALPTSSGDQPDSTNLCLPPEELRCLAKAVDRVLGPKRCQQMPAGTPPSPTTATAEVLSRFKGKTTSQMVQVLSELLASEPAGAASPRLAPLVALCEPNALPVMLQVAELRQKNLWRDQRIEDRRRAFHTEITAAEARIAERQRNLRDLQQQIDEIEQELQTLEEIPDRNTPVREAIPRPVQREVWRRDQGRCVQCGSRERLHFDHIVPVSRGGSSTARNIQLLCETCNLTKGNRI